MIGIPTVTYGAYERKQNEPSFDTLVKLCTVLNVSADWLLGIDRQQELTKHVEEMAKDAEEAATKLHQLMANLDSFKKKASDRA